MIDFIPSGQLGQNTPATEGAMRQGFSTAERILLAGVIISAVGLSVNLLAIMGYLGPGKEKCTNR